MLMIDARNEIFIWLLLQVEEAVHLYTKLGQHERAVGLALELHTDTDRQLAADCASGKLWRKVGKYPREKFRFYPV